MQIEHRMDAKLGNLIWLSDGRTETAAALDFAMQNDIVFRNVFSKVSIPNAGKEERKPLTDQQKRLLVETWQGHRMGVPALLMMYCGLRLHGVI